MNMNGMNRGGWVGVEALKGGKRRQRTYIVGSVLVGHCEGP